MRSGPTLMPSMVRLVSAMLVASTTFLAPTGVVSKMRACAEFPLAACLKHGGCQTEMRGLTGFPMPVVLLSPVDAAYLSPPDLVAIGGLIHHDGNGVRDGWNGDGVLEHADRGTNSAAFMSMQTIADSP